MYQFTIQRYFHGVLTKEVKVTRNTPSRATVFEEVVKSHFTDHWLGWLTSFTEDGVMIIHNTYTVYHVWATKA